MTKSEVEAILKKEKEKVSIVDLFISEASVCCRCVTKKPFRWSRPLHNSRSLMESKEMQGSVLFASLTLWEHMLMI